MPRAPMAKICCGATSGVPGRLPKRRCVREKSLEGWRGYANTSWGSRDTDCSLRSLSSVYVRKSSTRKAAWSYAVPTLRTEWPRCLGLNPVFPRCSKTVFEAGPGLEAASSTQPADKQRAGITFAVGLGRLLGWEASEVTEGQARGTHQRRRPRGHRRQQQNELADEASFAAHLSVLLLFCSVSAKAGKLLFRCLPRRSSRRPLLRYGPAIPLRRAAVLELDVVGREPQRSYRRQTSSMQRQAQVTGVRGVCVR